MDQVFCSQNHGARFEKAEFTNRYSVVVGSDPKSKRARTNDATPALHQRRIPVLLATS